MTTSDPEEPAPSGTHRIPIVEERLTVGKETVETGRVRLSSSVASEDVRVEETLTRVQVSVERLPVDLLLEDAPAVRTEPGRTVVPVFEEVLVRRFRVTEEVHLISEESEELVEQEVTLRHTRVEAERWDQDRPASG